MRTLNIWIGDRQVANVTAEDQPEGPAQYVIEYVDDVRDSELISLTLIPYSARRFVLHTFPPCFDMILPEGERAQRIREARKLLAADSFSLLAYVGQNPVNRVRILPPGMAPSPTVQQLPAPAEIAQCDRGLRLFEQLMRDLDLQQGIAGVQPKILGAADKSMLSLRNMRGSTHILKASTEKYPFLAANEDTCLAVYRHSGLPTPETQLSADGQLLMVRRFDLVEDGSMLGFEEFASLMGETSESKYRRDYGSLLMTARRFLSPADERTGRGELFQAMVLNYLLGNGDAHLKNFGVVYSSDVDVRLAPFYDCVCTLAYLPDDLPALCLSEQHYSKAWWSREQLEQFGRTYAELTAPEMTAMFERCSDAVAHGLQHLHGLRARIPAFADQGGVIAGIWKQRLADFRASPGLLPPKGRRK